MKMAAKILTRSGSRAFSRAFSPLVHGPAGASFHSLAAVVPRKYLYWVRLAAPASSSPPSILERRRKHLCTSSTTTAGSSKEGGRKTFQDSATNDALPKLKPLVVCGPSGVGKGSVIEALKKMHPRAFGFSVSHTTRKPRPGEEDGVHYNFVDAETIEKIIGEEGRMLEHAKVHGNIYGTSRSEVEKVLRVQGKICILDIDVQGCRQCRASGLEGTYVFVRPPSLEVLEARLRGRGTETEDKILMRLGNAQAEMDASQEPGLFDHHIVNDEVEAAARVLSSLVEEQVQAAAALQEAMKVEYSSSSSACGAASFYSAAERAGASLSSPSQTKAQAQDESPPGARLEDLVDFPCVFTIKVVGAAEGNFTGDTLDAIGGVVGRAGASLPYSTRDKGKWRSMTIEVPVETAAQLRLVYEAVGKDPRVKYTF